MGRKGEGTLSKFIRNEALTSQGRWKSLFSQGHSPTLNLLAQAAIKIYYYINYMRKIVQLQNLTMLYTENPSDPTYVLRATITDVNSLGKLSDLPAQSLHDVYNDKPTSFPRQVGYQLAAGECSFLPLLKKFGQTSFLCICAKELPTETEFNTRALSNSLTSNPEKET
jgi:hypothetical protein